MGYLNGINMEMHGYVWDNFEGYHDGISFWEMKGISKPGISNKDIFSRICQKEIS